MIEPVTIRASSFGSLFDCPSRWTAIHLEHLRSPQSSNAALGTAIHAGAAVFDSERVAGQVPSVEAAQDAAAESILRPREETLWDDPVERDKAEDVAVSITARYCTLESPKHDFVAVEASVESLLVEDLNIILTGHVDRVRQVDGQHGITDLKSGKTAVGTDGKAKAHGHAAQLGVYELVAQHATGLAIDAPAQIIGLQTNLTPDKQRIGTAEIEGSREVLLGDDNNTGLLVMASKIVHGQTEAWGNPKSMMCHPKYCPRFKTCFYRR